MGPAASLPAHMLGPLNRTQRQVVGTAVGLSAAAAAVHFSPAPQVVRFGVAAVALAALAALVGTAIEQVGERVGPGPTGLLQSALGNLPELFVAIFALRQGLVRVVQAALVGSVLSNLLLVLGLALLSGGLRHGPQRFPPEAPRMIVTLLVVAVGTLLVPTVAVRLHTPASGHAVTLSTVCAAVLLIVYLAGIPFWLRRDRNAADHRGSPAGTEPAAPEPPFSPWPLNLAVALLAVGSGLAAVVSDWFVAALTPAIASLHLSQAFTGLVVVAIASNAVENAVGVRFALRARPDFALSTILNSPLQVALLLTPVLVLASPALGTSRLTLVFPPLMVVALAVATVVVAIVVYDGEYTWLEGTALVALYVIVATAFWWG
jgi:Ca2+:H+ antiporter